MDRFTRKLLVLVLVLVLILEVLTTACTGRGNPNSPSPTGITYEECVGAGVPGEVCQAAGNDEARRDAKTSYDACYKNLMESGNWYPFLAEAACTQETVGWIASHYGAGGGTIPPDDQDGNREELRPNAKIDELEMGEGAKVWFLLSERVGKN